jgi:hypothetical protein
MSRDGMNEEQKIYYFDNEEQKYYFDLGWNAAMTHIRPTVDALHESNAELGERLERLYKTLLLTKEVLTPPPKPLKKTWPFMRQRFPGF